MTCSAFVNDLVPLILEAQQHWWPRDFVQLALVSSAWLHDVRKRLYSVPRLHSAIAIGQLARSLRNNPALSNYVTGYALLPTDGSVSWSDVRQLLALEGIQRLALGGELAVRAERIVRLVAFPEHLRELEIDGSLISGRPHEEPSLEWDESITCLLGSLKTLRLTNIDLDVEPARTQRPLSVKSLTLHNVCWTNGGLLDLLNGACLLHELDVATTDKEEHDEQVCAVLEHCAVESLRYTVEKDTAEGWCALDVESTLTQSMRRLHLDGILVDAGWLSVIEEKYRGLEELSVVGRLVRVTADEWAAFMLRTSLRARLPMGTNCPPFSRWPKEEICALQETLRDRLLI